MSALGIPRRTLIIVGLVLLTLWVLAISSESIVFMSIVGVLTAALFGLIFWLLRLRKKQQNIVSLLEGAVSSPEARKEAIAKLAADKDANEATHVFARAQLEAADDPAKALETIESLDMKDVPVYLQDDVALLRSQLYLRFGRPKDARPLVDRINVNNPQRKEGRALMVSVVAEVWARTGKATEANELLDTVDINNEANMQVRAQLLAARVFARFAAGKKGGARKDLQTLAAIDPDHLGRFVIPQFRAHPELQRMARSIAEQLPQVRKMARPRRMPRGGRPR